jgi:hypothetical protein
MRSPKLLGGAVLPAIALMAIAGHASATVLTSSTGEVGTVGTEGTAVAEGSLTLSGTVNVTCKKATIEGVLTNAGSSSTTASGSITNATVEECGSTTVTIVNKGTTEVHTDTESANGNGTITSSGAQVTGLTHSILGTVHCIYISNNTFAGTLTGSKNKEGGNATVVIESVPVPQATTDFGCGSTSEVSGSFKAETPAYVDVD